MDFYCNERMQERFKGKTPAEFRTGALTADVPKQYPIPENKRIQKYKPKICCMNRPAATLTAAAGRYFNYFSGLLDKGRFR